MFAVCRLITCCLILLATTGLVVHRTVGPVGVDRTVQGMVIGSAPDVRATTEDFVDGRHGFVTGQTPSCPGKGCVAALLATENGGQSWRTVHTGVAFSRLSFVSPRLGFGVDGDGRLLETRDAGHHWFVNPAPAPKASGVDFVDARYGWLLAGSLYRTVDGGGRWTRLRFHCGRFWMIARISFINRDAGFLLCADSNGPFVVSLFQSADGGASWRRVSIVDHMAHDLGAFDFVSPRLGFVSVGFGNLLRTDDGGHSFQLVPNTPFDVVLAASWLDPRTGYVAAYGVLMRTADAGRHWRQVYPPIQPEGPISLTVSGAGLVAGNRWSPRALLRTGNGIVWRQIGQLPVSAIDHLVRTSNSTVWAVAGLEEAHATESDGVLFRSRDNGRQWQRMLEVPGGIGFLSFAGPRVGFLTTTLPDRLYVTHDGGKTWAMRTESISTWDDQFVSDTSGWAFSRGLGLLHTDDGGRHWQPVPIRRADLNPDGLYFLSPNVGWIVVSICGATPLCAPGMLRTRDGGAHWILIRFPQSFAFEGFDWVTPQLGFVMQHGALYRTRDGGISWRIVRG